MQERFRVSEGDDVIQWGDLEITSVRFVFVPRGGEAQETQHEVSVFMASIARLEKVIGEDDVMIRVSTKDARSVTLWFEGAPCFVGAWTDAMCSHSYRHTHSGGGDEASGARIRTHVTGRSA